MDKDLRELHRKAYSGDVRTLLALDRMRERYAPTQAERIRLSLEALALRIKREHGVK
jgi:hypothetical protein